MLPSRFSAACALLAALASAAPALAGDPPSPQLLVTDAELPALRARLRRPPFAARWQAYLNKVAVPLPAKPAKLEDLASVRWLAWSAINHAFVYRVTGEAEHAEAAWKALEPALGWDTWHRDWDWNHGAELPTAILSQAAGVVYDTCADALSEAQRTRLRERAATLGLDPYLASIEEHRDWWVKEPHSNWTGTVHGQCGVLALALRRELPRAERAARLAHEHVLAFLETSLGKDGAGYEGVMYFRAGLEPAVIFLHTWARTLGEPGDWGPLPVLARERLLGYWDVYLHGPDQVYANFNDMGAETFAGLFAENPGKNTFGGPNANLAALWESFWPKGDPLLLWAADHGGGGDFSRGIAPWWFLWRRDAPPSGERPPLDPAVLFRDAGHAVLQSPRLWVALQGGWIPDSSIHKNFDLGSFVLVADGARRVPDPGYGKKGAELHSVLVLPGKDGTPREQVAGARGRYLALDAGDRWRYAAVDLSAAYGDAVPRWVRHVLLLGDDTAVILDQVALAQAGPAELRVQLASEARLEGQRALVAGDPPLSVDVLGATPELVATPRALALRLDPQRAEHLALTVLRVGAPGPTPELRQGKKGLTLSTAAGKLELVQRGGAYVPAKLGREKLSPGDPAARSLERPGGKRRRR